jgi:hypothetical protein
MTTTVKVHVNGRYRATVTQITADHIYPPVVVEGNYEGSPNPSGEHAFYVSHPAQSLFQVTEEYVPETKCASYADHSDPLNWPDPAPGG